MHLTGIELQHQLDRYKINMYAYNNSITREYWLYLDDILRKNGESPNNPCGIMSTTLYWLQSARLKKHTRGTLTIKHSENLPNQPQSFSKMKLIRQRVKKMRPFARNLLLTRHSSS